MKMKEVLAAWGRIFGASYREASPKDNPPKKKRRPDAKLLILSLGCLVSGLLLLFFSPYNFIFKYKLIFSEGGEIFEMWRKPDVQLYLRVYLFNVTNSAAFMRGEEPMNVEQVGPYVYRELIEHANVTFNDNGTASTVPLHPLRWEPELSAPNKEDDMLILPNIAMLSIAHKASDLGLLVRLPLNGLLRTTGSQPLTKMTAKDFMFGYATPLVTLGNSFLPGWIKFDKLGLIDRMYDFDNDFETVFTGGWSDEEEAQAGLMDKWRGSTDLPQWPGKCGNIHGASDGSKFRGHLKEDQKLLFYRKSLCRAAPIVKTGEGYRSGLKAWRFTPEVNALDNGLRDPENKCFCRQGHCLADGLIDVTDCYYGFPIALSYPHFLNADPSLVSNVRGLRPQQHQHESFFWLEPRSGLPLDVAGRFQINMALTKDMSSIRNCKPFSNMTVPLLWFEIRMFDLPPSMATRFQLYLSVLPALQSAVQWLCLLAAPFLLTTALVLTLRGRRKKERHSMKTSYLPRRLSAADAKMQGVYALCEVPLSEGEESASPFLKTDLKERAQTLASRLQDSVRGLARRLSGASVEKRREEASNEGFSDSAQSSSEDGATGQDGYRAVRSADEADTKCEMEVVDDEEDLLANAAAVAAQVTGRRRSLELARRMQMIEAGDWAKLPFLPEEQV